MPRTTSRRKFLAGGVVAAGGTLAAGALSTAGASRPAFAAAVQSGFVEGHPENPHRDSVRRIVTAEEQKPFAIILTCSDSRLPPEVIFDKGIGDLFVVRVAGNTATDPVLIGSMEYSVITFGSVLLMVLGHTDCGAVKATVDVVTKDATLPGELDAVTQPIEPAVEAVQTQPADQILDAAIHENVKLTQEGLGQISTFADAVQSGKLKIVGYEYQLKTGKVTPV